MRKHTKRLLTLALALFMVCPLALAENTEAPRAYFPYPAELESLPDNFSLPNPFIFFDASADPNGNGTVDSPEEWDARAAELKDMLQYYAYGNRHDPLKTDSTIVGIRRNYQYVWAEGVVAAGGFFGPSVPPALPEGAATFSVMEWRGTTYYRDIAPNYDYVHAGEDYQLPGELGVWKAGEGWDAHPDVVQNVLLPTVSVDLLIKDSNPENDAIRSEAAVAGVPFTVTFRFPQEAPIVDGVLRDEKASRHGAGYPIVIGIGGLSDAQGLTLTNNGYAYATVSDSANPDSNQLSVYEQVYPPIDPVVYNDNTIVNDWARDTGDLMHSGWMASRFLDALENYKALSDEEKAAISDVIIPDIDVYSSAITGCSNNGKRAIIGGIFDTGDNGKTRFDIITASDSGGGGLTGYRYSTEGQLFSYLAPQTNSGANVVLHDYPYGLNETMQRAIQNTGEDHWFADRAQILTVRPDLADNVPFDLHELVALFASSSENRYFFTWTCEAQDAWSNSPATVLNIQAAKEVYEYLGQGDNIGVAVRDQAHANQDRDLPDLIAVMDHEYYGVETYTRKFFDTLTAGDGTTNAKDGSGTILPTKVFDSLAAMSRNPYFIPSSYLDWSRPGKHTLWTDANSVTEGVPLTFTFHTDAAKVELLLTDGVTVLSADVVDGVALIPLTAEQAKAGQYKATAIGDKDGKSIEICGWTVNDALRHALADNSALGHDVGTGIAFTTPLQNYNSVDDAPVLYMDGELVPADIYDYDNKITLADGTVIPQHGYLQPYGATLILYEGTMGYNVPMGGKVVFGIRNAKIEALQGYTLNMDVEYEKYAPSDGRMRFKPTYNTLTAQTPVWEPDLLQNTPKSGLPADETCWPILGNWKHDFDAEGNLKPIEEIRPTHTVKGEAAYKVEITAGASDVNGVTLNFSAPVSTKDFAVAINCGSAVSFEWAEDAQSVKVVYDAPVEAGTEVTLFVFRSVDSEGNMIGGPVKFVVTAE